MLCYICCSTFHVTQNCDKKISDECHHKIATANIDCRGCLSNLCKNNSWNCFIKKKCYLCFLSHHHTSHCPDRIKEPFTFAPKIDNDLLSRFLELLQFEEKISVIFSFPKFFNCIKSKPFKVKYIQDLSAPQIKKNKNFDIIVSDNFHSEKARFNFTSIKPTIFYIKNIDISHVSSFDILQLLSHKTETLRCEMEEYRPNVTFRDILEKSPNLERIDIRRAKITVSNLWPEDLLRLNRAENLCYIHLNVPDLNFDTESLVALLKKPAAKNAKVFLYIFLPPNVTFNEALENGRKKLSKYFIPKKNEEKQFLSIRYKIIESQNISTSESECYKLKNE